MDKISDQNVHYSLSATTKNESTVTDAWNIVIFISESETDLDLALEFLPFLHLGTALLLRLCLHLLDLDRVRLAAAHIELVITHAQGQDPLVDTEARGEKDKIRSLLINRLDDEFSVVKRDIADL